MMLLVQCGVVVVFYIIVICHADDGEEEATDIHGDITGPGPGEYLPTLPEDENMFAKVFKYAFDNYYKNSSTPKKINSQKSSSQENRKKPYKHYPRQKQYYNAPYQAANPPMAPYQPWPAPAQALPPQYIFPQHYYMPPVPPVPPYPMYHYPPPYPPHAYPYPYPPPQVAQVKEKSAETKTTQNLWELYKELKAKFETTVVTTPEPTQQEYYHRHYNRRVQNGAGGYVPRDNNNRRYNYQYQQQVYQQQQQQQQEAEKVPEEPFVRYTPLQSNQRRDNDKSPPQMFKVKEAELKTSPPIITTVTHPQENPQGVTVVNGGNEHVFEPREEDDENVKAAKVKHWEGIINNIKSSLGITDEPESNDATLPEYVKREHAEIASLFFTESPEDLEAKKYGITLIQNSQPESYEKNDAGFDWKAEEKAAAEAAKATKDWVQLYKEYKDKYEFPDYLQEKRRIERAEYKAKKKMLYKSRGLTYDDGQPDNGATFGDNTFLNLGRDPNYYPAVMRNYLKK